MSDDQKTHKNPNLRGQAASVRTGPKPFSSPASKPAASAAPARTLPPVLELDGKKWKVVGFWTNQSTTHPKDRAAFSCSYVIAVEGKAMKKVCAVSKHVGVLFLLPLAKVMCLCNKPK